MKFKGELTNDQLDFLQHHNVPLEKVFDAKKMPKELYHYQMRQQGKIVAFNVTPCKAHGHTLRTRHGHCIQCNPAHLEFQKRNDTSGILYIAGSSSGKILKVGFSKQFSVRNNSLNRTKYAGFKDWKIVFWIFSTLAGEIESKIKPELSKYERRLHYTHDGHLQETKEVYSCSFAKAKSIILKICSNSPYNYEIKRDFVGDEFNFKTLRKR